jgi:hypothetical protein
VKKFFPNTDTVDIEARSLGIHGPGYKARGLCIQIRHNLDYDLLKSAGVMQDIIVEALNGAVLSGRLQLPEQKVNQ